MADRRRVHLISDQRCASGPRRRCRGPVLGPRPPTPTRILDRSGPMIFIVDDDQSVRTSLSRLMRSAGYEARAFAGAEEYLDDVGGAALSAPATAPPPPPSSASGCVILDLNLPGMSGLDLQKVIGRREASMPV